MTNIEYLRATKREIIEQWIKLGKFCRRDEIERIPLHEHHS